MERQELISQIVEKKEFQELPIGVIERVLEIKEIKNKLGEQKIKEARAFLRKYFSVFMTNKIISGKLNEKEILDKHISTKGRDYHKLYPRILEKEDMIIDLGAGLNGFSYSYLPKKSRYVAVEAIKRFVQLMEEYFIKNKFNAIAYHQDLFDLEGIIKVINREKGKKAIFLFNVIDALERIEKDYSKKLILKLIGLVDKVIISWPIKSISGKNKFKAKRFWIISFIENNFLILNDFESNGERFIVFRKR